MTTRNGTSVWRAFVTLCLLTCWVPAAVRGDGSIAFNGTSSPSGGTSKLENTTANVLNSVQQVTVCCWINAEGLGEGNLGILLSLDETDGTEAFTIRHQSASNTLQILKSPGGSGNIGIWTIPVTDGAWNGVCVRLDFSGDNAPTARVNFSAITPNTVSTPSGIQDQPATGYCVGNRNGGDRTWDGRIAYMQVFNRILSDSEADAGLQAPGSVSSGLRLWLPMTNASDINDRSGNGFNGTATDLVTDVTGPMVTDQPGVLPGVTMLTHGVTNKTQHEIKRFANGVSYPAGQLRGVGPASVLRATADTDDLASNKRGIVITEDCENPTAQWQSDTETTRKAVLQAAVRDLTIAGYDETGTEYATGGLVNNNPANWNRITGSITNTTGNGVAPIYITSANHTLQDGDVVTISGVLGNTNANGTFSVYDVVNADTFLIDANGNGAYAGGGVWTCTTRWPDKYDGLLMRSSGLLVDNVNFFYIPGKALVVKKGGTGGQTGPKLMFDREKARIWDCKVNRSYRGFWIDDVDTVVGRLEGSDLRDYGIKFVKGNAQIDGSLHFWGVGGYGVDQPAVWFADGAGPSWGGPIYAESSPVGMKIESSGNKLSGFYSHSCSVRNLWISGQRNSVSDFEIEVQDGVTETSGGEGVLIAEQANTLSNGTFGGLAAVPGGEVAIRLANGTRQVLRDISFVGTDGSSAPLISVAHPLKDSIIDARCIDGGTFLDLYRIASGTAGGGGTSTIVLDARETLGSAHFVVADVTTSITITGGTGGSPNQTRTITAYDSATKTATVSSNWSTVPDQTSTYVIEGDRLGSNNRIYITAAQNTGKDINLDPTGWDKNTNLIVVNGIRVLGPITGATNATPIVITSAGHEVRNGELVSIEDVEGNTNANGTYYAKWLSDDTFSLYTNPGLTTGRAGNAAYTTNTGYWGKRFNSVDAAGD